ncbi:MAG: thiamine diphosphokinase [Christensenellaceae bacterium]|nr:thiamine diphosphokinase [Christensenellaceae bacterium]
MTQKLKRVLDNHKIQDKQKSVGIILNGVSNQITTSDDYIIVADGGLKNAKNIKIDILIGDFDSIDTNQLPEGIKKITYNSEKNETDGELAINFAVELGYKRINIYAALGGRTDHLLGNLALLSLASSLNAIAVIKDIKETIFFVTKKISFMAPKNTYVSIVPFGGNATIKNSQNLKYKLNKTEIKCNNTLGISNIAIDEKVCFEIEKGEVLVFVNSADVDLIEII